MNKVILIGRLTKDPTVSYSQGERSMAIARFTLAVDRRFTRRDSNNPEQQTADFIQCVAFDKQGEFVEKYFHQGAKMVFEGRIQTGSYINKDGQRVFTTDFVAENIEFAESKKTASGNSGYNNVGNQSGRPSPENASADGFMNIPDGEGEDDLPY